MATRDTIAAFRFGYGFRPGETPPGPEAMLDGVRTQARAAAGVTPSFAERDDLYVRHTRLGREPGVGPNNPRLVAMRQIITDRLNADRMARVSAAVLSPDGFYERLVWFWSDHFTVAIRELRGRSTVGSFEAEAIRPNVAGSFGGLLRAAVRHPVMLDYLSQSRSVGPTSRVGRARKAGLNENLAREVLELHTLGVGADYGQADVREFAELLTGLVIDRAAGVAAFRPDMAEPGPETVLGRSYGGETASEADIDAVLADLAVHPATARHIAWKLAVHFVDDAPDPGLVAHLEAAFRESGGALMAVYAALLEHPASWTPVGAKVRQPFDFVVASIRAAGVGDAAALARLAVRPETDPLEALQRLNQPIWAPPAPDGWPEAADAWISAPGLTARIDWASRMGEAFAPTLDPRAFVDAALGDLARPDTRFVAQAAAERWEGIALVLAAPEFNRR